MKQMRRAAIYKLAASAHEMELDVMNGVLRRDDDDQLFAVVGVEPGQQVVVADVPAAVVVSPQDTVHHVQFHLVGGGGQFIDGGAAHLFHLFFSLASNVGRHRAKALNYERFVVQRFSALFFASRAKVLYYEPP